MIKKILLINPPNTMPADSVRRIAEPLSLLYLVPGMKEKGFQVKVFDACCEGYDTVVIHDGYVTYGSSPEEIKKVILDYAPDVVGVNCMFTARQKNALAVCKIVKDISGDIKVVMGGLQPTLFPQRMIESGVVDFVILNEGENRFVKLLELLRDGKKEFDVDGLAYRNGASIVVNKPIGYITDLDAIPFPDRDAVDMQKYFEIARPYAPFAAERNTAQFLATRGCFNRCNFCSTVYFWGQKVRTRSVDNIIAEMQLLKDRYDVREIQFVDDNLTANKNLARELFTRMKDLGLKWCTPHGLMFNTLDNELIRLMAESGAYQITLAIESASERVLNEIIHKKVTLSKVKSIVDEAHKYDIGVHGMFLTGFPGETRDEIIQTINFPFTIGFDSISLFIVNPLPGSELFQQCIDKKYLIKDFNSMDFKSANIRIPKNDPQYNMDPDELLTLVDTKTREYNEWAKKEYPERWARKFQRYLLIHPEEKDKIMGRVT